MRAGRLIRANARDDATGARGVHRSAAEVIAELLAQCDPANPEDADAIAHLTRRLHEM